MSISACVILHISVITKAGWSALIWAAGSGKTEVIPELVKAGANVDMKNIVCQYQYCVHVHVFTIKVYSQYEVILAVNVDV